MCLDCGAIKLKTYNMTKKRNLKTACKDGKESAERVTLDLMDAREMYRLRRIQEITALLTTLTNSDDKRFISAGHELDLLIDVELFRNERDEALKMLRRYQLDNAKAGVKKESKQD